MLVAAITAGALALPGATSAAAAELPECQYDNQWVELSVPQVTHVGQHFSIKLLAEEPDEVTNVVLTLTNGRGEAQQQAVTLAGRRTEVVLESGPTPDFGVKVAVEWDYGVFMEEEPCHGREWTWLPNLPAGKSGGKWWLPRFAGRYTVRGHSRRQSYASKWSLKPSCDYFACMSRIRHSPLVFDPDEKGVYTAALDRGRIQTCEIEYHYGNGPTRIKRIHRAWHLYFEFVVRPTQVVGGVIKRFRGKIITILEPTAYARRWHCIGARATLPIRGRLLSG